MPITTPITTPPPLPVWVCVVGVVVVVVFVVVGDFAFSNCLLYRNLLTACILLFMFTRCHTRGNWILLARFLHQPCSVERW